MDVEVKDLEFYKSNPNAIGELSEEQLEQLALQEGETGKPGSGEAPAAAAAQESNGKDVAKDAPATPEKVDPPAAEAKPEDVTPSGVATKDGKNIIPFEVLQQERNRVAHLERIAQEQAAQIAALAEKAKGGEGDGKPKDAASDVPVLSEEQIAELENVAPEARPLVAVVRAQQEQLKALNETTRALIADRQAQQQEVQRTAQQTLQEAIDGNPKLTYLQAAGDHGWQRAVLFDQALRQDPEWASKPFADRFAKVVDLYESTYGEIKLPGQSSKPAATPQPSQDDLAKAAEAKLQGKGADVPTSLSNIPGGATPAADDVLGALASKSGPELTADFMRMTPAQIEAMVSRL